MRFNFRNVTWLFRNATRCVPTNDGAMCQNDACSLSVSCRVKPAMTRAHFDTPPIFSDNSFVLRHIRATGDRCEYSTYMMPCFRTRTCCPINRITNFNASYWLRYFISSVCYDTLQCSQTICSCFYHSIRSTIIIIVKYHLIRRKTTMICSMI